MRIFALRLLESKSIVELSLKPLLVHSNNVRWVFIWWYVNNLNTSGTFAVCFMLYIQNLGIFDNFWNIIFIASTLRTYIFEYNIPI